MNIEHIQEVEDLIEAYEFLELYFKPYELVRISDFIFYARNYHALYKDEDYLVYSIKHHKEIIGIICFVKLKELISVDYLAISKNARSYTKDIISSLMSMLKKYNVPIICEAENNVLVRFYEMNGFKKFEDPYCYYILEKDKISSHSSNLMYLHDKALDFHEVKQTLFRKHYLRWNKIYGEDYVREYKKILGL